jgi:hypothetical protein
VVRRRAACLTGVSRLRVRAVRPRVASMFRRRPVRPRPFRVPDGVSAGRFGATSTPTLTPTGLPWPPPPPPACWSAPDFRWRRPGSPPPSPWCSHASPPAPLTGLRSWIVGGPGTALGRRTAWWRDCSSSGRCWPRERRRLRCGRQRSSVVCSWSGPDGQGGSRSPGRLPRNRVGLGTAATGWCWPWTGSWWAGERTGPGNVPACSWARVRETRLAGVGARVRGRRPVGVRGGMAGSRWGNGCGCGRRWWRPGGVTRWAGSRGSCCGGR